MAVLTLRAILAFVTVVAIARPLRAALGTLGDLGFAVGVSHFGAFVLVTVAVIVAVAALVLEAGPALAENAEIMIRELQIIFGLDAIAAELRIARHALVFLEQLGGIAALAVVLAIASAPAAGHSWWALPTAATTTAALTIIDQAVCSLSHWRLNKRRKTFHSKVRFPGSKAAGAKALAAPVMSDAQIFRVHGPMASGVAAEALGDCLKRLRA